MLSNGLAAQYKQVSIVDNRTGAGDGDDTCSFNKSVGGVCPVQGIEEGTIHSLEP